MRIRGGQARFDGALEVWDGIGAAAGFLQQVTQPKVCLRIPRIEAEDIPQRGLESRTVQFTRDDARELGGKLPAILGICS